jgi:hypothetical protein
MRRKHPRMFFVFRTRCYSQAILISIAKGLIRYLMMAAALASASGQTSQVTTLNGNWEFALRGGRAGSRAACANS